MEETSRQNTFLFAQTLHVQRAAIHNRFIYTTHLLSHWNGTGLNVSITNQKWCQEADLSQWEYGEARYNKGMCWKGLHVSSHGLAFIFFSKKNKRIKKRNKIKPEVSYFQEMPIVVTPLHYWCPCLIAHHSPPPPGNKHKHRKISWRTLFLKQKPHHRLLAWHSYRIILYILPFGFCV